MSPDTNYGLGSRLAHNVESSVDIDARSAGTCGQRAAAASPGRVVAATVAFALVHSALASRGAKAAAVTLLGARRRNGLYRAFFNTQAALMSAALASYLRELPDRHLYTVRYPAAALMRAGQAAGVLLLLDAVRHIGVTRVTGISSVLSLARGDDAVAAEPEAQGPRIQEDGRLRIGGAFTRSRHPLNLAAVPILWLNPRMTRNRICAFTA